MIKSYVIDTNILIQAPYACQCFEENRVILPLVVLEDERRMYHLFLAELILNSRNKSKNDLLYGLFF